MLMAHVASIKCNCTESSVSAFSHSDVPKALYNNNNMKPLQMAWCVWLEETVPGRVGSKFSTTVTGGRCVMTTGPSSTQRWSADSWATGTETLTH